MPSTTIQHQIERATNRLAQLKAKELMKQATAQAKARSIARREDAHRKITLGGLVIAAGADNAGDEALLVGMLLDALDRLSRPEYRAAVREQGFQHLEARKTERGRP
ncbi:conjugal transfer protein TraD [Rhodanobacter denitrificans]|nr:conjugal transfer protein TraD [Rhodanobacter denitrificans]